jgi:hypothetical protein
MHKPSVLQNAGLFLIPSLGFAQQAANNEVSYLLCKIRSAICNSKIILNYKDQQHRHHDEHLGQVFLRTRWVYVVIKILYVLGYVAANKLGGIRYRALGNAPQRLAQDQKLPCFDDPSGKS